MVIEQFGNWVIYGPPGATFNYQITKFSNYPMALGVGLVLGLHVARFATWPAIVLAILAEAHVVLRTAQPAIFVAGAAPLDLVAESANKVFGHRRSLEVLWLGRKVTNGWEYLQQSPPPLHRLSVFCNTTSQFAKSAGINIQPKGTFLMW